MAIEIKIQIREENWDAALDNEEINPDLTFDLSFGSPEETAVFYGHSLGLGMVKHAIWAMPWNPTSGTGYAGRMAYAFGG